MSGTQVARAAHIFALVAYLPDPLGSYLDEIRNRFPAQRGGKAHLTFLPPRTIHGEFYEATEQITQTLLRFNQFEVELTEVLRFEGTNVLYIGVGQGAAWAYRIHSSLNRGTLAFDEPYEYRPHVTLALPAEGVDICEMQEQAADCWDRFSGQRRFRVTHLDFLGYSISGDWQKLWTGSLR